MEEMVALVRYIYEVLNRRYFNRALSIPPIKLVTGKHYVACIHSVHMPDAEWLGERVTDMSVSVNQIGTSEGFLETLTGAILHEMIHQYCIVNMIPHYDKTTGEHLPGFIAEADRRGLIYDDWMSTNILVEDLDEIFGCYDDAPTEGLLLFRLMSKRRPETIHPWEASFLTGI